MTEIIEIQQFDDPALDVFARMTETQLRSRLEPEKGIFIAEGLAVIGHALDAGCAPLAFLMERKHIEGKAADTLKRCPDTPVYTADSSVLAELTGFELTRGVLCAMRRPQQRSIAQICGKASRIAVIEGLIDPTNVGAIFRSAAALGMEAVLLDPRCCDPLHRRAVRVSMGTVFQIPWSRFEGDWPAEGMDKLKSMGFKTAAMALSDDSVSIDDPALMNEEKLALVFGSEGNGLRNETISMCDYTVKIPMSNGVDSLNVAASSAVAFWQLRKR